MERVLWAGYPRDTYSQAQALFEALRRERAYFPDPVDAEFIPSAACQLDGCDGLTFLGEDCDGLVVAFLAACASIGIEGAVVGHSYDASGHLSHVLAAVHVGDRWVLSDPSTTKPFGQVDTATRQVWVTVPGEKVLCDGRTCSVPPNTAGKRMRGEFVGVGRPQGGFMAEPKAQTYVGSALRQMMIKIVSDKISHLKRSFERTRREHAKLEMLREEMQESLTDPEHWTNEREAYYQRFSLAYTKTVQYCDEAKSGRRPMMWDENNQEPLVLGEQGEQRVDVTQDGAINIETTQPTDAIEPVGWQIPVIVGAVVLVAIGSVVTMIAVSGMMERTLDRALQSSLLKIYDSAVANGATPSEAANIVGKLGNSLSQATAPAPEKDTTLGKLSDLVVKATYAAAVVGGLGVGAYFLIKYTNKAATA